VCYQADGKDVGKFALFLPMLLKGKKATVPKHRDDANCVRRSTTSYSFGRKHSMTVSFGKQLKNNAPDCKPTPMCVSRRDGDGDCDRILFTILEHDALVAV
jgi:hypothetical protein